MNPQDGASISNDTDANISPSVDRDQLRLNKETLQDLTLSDADVEAVRGGAPAESARCAPESTAGVSIRK